MEVRLATIDDIFELETMYIAIIKDMNDQGFMFWTQEYPLKNVIGDIPKGIVYVLTENNTIISCFTLNEDNPGNNDVDWIDNDASYLYIDRLGVNVNYKRKGIASLSLKKAIQITATFKKDYLRLFVASTNTPALELYCSNNFKIATGAFYDTVNGIYVKELGIEIKV